MSLVNVVNCWSWLALCVTILHIYTLQALFIIVFLNVKEHSLSKWTQIRFKVMSSCFSAPWTATAWAQTGEHLHISGLCFTNYILLKEEEAYKKKKCMVMNCLLVNLSATSVCCRHSVDLHTSIALWRRIFRRKFKLWLKARVQQLAFNTNFILYLFDLGNEWVIRLMHVFRTNYFDLVLYMFTVFSSIKS